MSVVRISKEFTFDMAHALLDAVVSSTTPGTAGGALQQKRKNPLVSSLDLRTAIAEKFTPNFKDVSSTFKTLEDGTETVMLDGQQMATATFAINVQLFTGEEKAPQPARRKK